MKLDGSSGPENNGVRKDHTTINEKNAAPILMAFRAAIFSTTPKHRRFARIQLRLQVRVTNNDRGQGLQRLLAIGRELLWLLAQAAKAHVSPMHVLQ
jgi:hypothetical protein